MDAPKGPLSRFLEAAAYAAATRNGDLGVVKGVFKIKYYFTLVLGC
jgi:hypothetical protein